MRNNQVKVVEAAVPALRSERARRMQQVKKLEWDFDQHPKLETAQKLLAMREELSELELQIAEGAEESAMRSLIKRMEALGTNAGSGSGSNS